MGKWRKKIGGPQAGSVDETFETANGLQLDLHDADGVSSNTREFELEPAQQADKAYAAIEEALAKLGNTMFYAEQIDLQLRQAWFIPSSIVNALRRDAVAAHEQERLRQWQRPLRTPAQNLWLRTLKLV